MSLQMVSEILAAQADRLVAGEEHTDDYLVLFPELRSQLAPLLQLARDVATALKPVHPRPAYRSELHRALVSAGYDQQLHHTAIPESVTEMRRDWVLGAAALGSAVSVVGVIAYFWRARVSGTKAAPTPH